MRMRKKTKIITPHQIAVAIAFSFSITVISCGGENNQSKTQPSTPSENCTCNCSEMKTSLDEMTADRNNLYNDFEKFKANAKLSDEHALYEEARQKANNEHWKEAQTAFQDLIDHYPNSPLAKTAINKLTSIERILKKQEKIEAAERKKQEKIEAAERKKQEKIEAAERKKQEALEKSRELDKLTSSQISAQIGKYKGREIIRELDCSRIDKPIYIEQGYSPYFSRCDLNRNNDIEVYYDTKGMQRVLALGTDRLGTYKLNGRFRILGRSKLGMEVALKFIDFADDTK